MQDQRDGTRDRGSVLPAVVVGAALVAAVVVAGAAFAQSASTPSGEAVLNDTAEHYRSANSLTGTAEVTVSNATEQRSATVEYAAARPDGLRVSTTYNGTTVSAGTNGTLAWVSAPGLGIERAWEADHAFDGHDAANATAACEAVRSHAMAFAANHSAAMARGMDAAREHNLTGPAMAAANPQTIDCAALAVNRTEMRDHVPTDRPAANLTATTTGTTTLDGTEAYVVSIEPENETTDLNATMVVAKNDSRLLEQRVTDGENTSVVRYHDQHFNVSIDDSTFAPPTARADTETATYDDFGVLQSDTDHALPTLGADGYAFEGAAVTNADGTTVAQRYANATTNATLVSTDSRSVPYDALNGTSVEVGGHDATVATMGGQSVVVWTDGDTTYAVVTDGSTDETTALARTVST